MMSLEAKYENLLAENKRLSKKSIEFDSKLRICQQKCLTSESALNLSQKLVQHLKTDLQKMESLQLDLTSLDDLLGQTVNNSMSTFDAELADITEIIDSNMPSGVTDLDHQSADHSIDPNSGLSESDLIISQYEKQIKELVEDIELFSCLPIDKVVITGEDQRLANSYLPDLEIKLKCKYCSRKFADLSTLDSHKELHKSSDGQQIRCAEDLCGHQFNTKHELKDHLKTVHMNDDKSATKLDSIKSKSELSSSKVKRVFECNECQKQLSSKQSYRQHLKNVHNIATTFKCRYSGCDLLFDKWLDLRAHQQIHRESTVGTSDVTQTPIETPDIILTYVTTPEKTPQTQPKPKKLFICEYEGCHSSYSRKINLKIHEKKIHSNIMNCNTSFVNVVPQPAPPTATKAKPTPDIHTRLQMLELFLAEQEKVPMAAHND